MIENLSHKSIILIGLVTVVLIAAGMIVFELATSDLGSADYLEDGKLSDAQKESLHVMLDLQKLLMNWSIATIGAAGFFLKLNVEKDVPLRPIDIILSLLVIIIAVVSLFFGHLAIEKSSEMLYLDQFPVGNQEIRTIGAYQYITGLGAIALFGFHVFQFFAARMTNR
ncbi:MAG: hypothetical protein AAGA21_00405 [Pseudomonadota bacterium]